MNEAMRTRGSWATASLAAVVMMGSFTGCFRSTKEAGPAPFEVVWSSDPSGGVNRGELLAAPHTVISEGAVLDPASGEVRWSAPTTFVGTDGEQLFSLRRDADVVVGLERYDVQTGARLGVVMFADRDGTAKPLRGGFQLLIGGERAVSIYLGRVSAYALETGREVWATDLGSTSSWAVISGDLLGVVRTVRDGAGRESKELLALSLHDGGQRWRASMDAYSIEASPRGGFFVSTISQVIELGASGAVLRSIPGRFGSARGELLAVTESDDIVVVDGKGQQVDRIAPAAAGDYVSAPGLCDGAVVYFRSLDNTVWWRELRGAERPVVRLGSSYGLTEKGLASAEPILMNPPECAGSLLFLWDQRMTAYRIPRK